jgi:inosine/xanthosine triphosphate pyrophosphatase family protein
MGDSWPSWLAGAAAAELGVDDVPETGLTFVENALLKARHACRAPACRRWPTTRA